MRRSLVPMILLLGSAVAMVAVGETLSVWNGPAARVDASHLVPKFKDFGGSMWYFEDYHFTTEMPKRKLNLSIHLKLSNIGLEKGKALLETNLYLPDGSKIQVSKRYKLEVNDAEVEMAFAEMAKRLRLSSQQLIQTLAHGGVDAATL